MEHTEQLKFVDRAIIFFYNWYSSTSIHDNIAHWNYLFLAAEAGEI